MLSVVVYECKTWSLTLREEHKQRVFKSRVIKRYLGLRRGEVPGDCGNCTIRSYS